MRKYNPYRNIYYYYRGPSNSKYNEYGDRQIEDNTTKALINTLENSEQGLLSDFLKHLGIPQEEHCKTQYDLQIAKVDSRPDALIQMGSTQIFIESKIDCPLENKQLLHHIKALSKGYLICITPRVSDERIVKTLNDKRIRFITWKEIYIHFERHIKASTSDKTCFLISEFINYLEAINMAPFYGWRKSHFEAFLNIDDDPSTMLMQQSKANLQQYLFEIKEHLKNSPSFDGLEVKVGMLNSAGIRHCWGVLAVPPLDKIINMPHFNFRLNADEFALGVQIEGKKPAHAFKKTVTQDPKKLLRISRKLEGFDLTLRKRVYLHPRTFLGIPVVRIALGDNVSDADISFLIQKMTQYNLFEINCTKSFKRDDEAVRNTSFVKTSTGLMKQLEPYYRFSMSGMS